MSDYWTGVLHAGLVALSVPVLFWISLLWFEYRAGTGISVGGCKFCKSRQYRWPIFMADFVHWAWPRWHLLTHRKCKKLYKKAYKEWKNQEDVEK